MDASKLFNSVSMWGATPIKSVAGQTTLFERQISGKNFQFSKLPQESRWDMGMETIEVSTLISPLLDIGFAMKKIQEKHAAVEDEDERTELIRNDAAPIMAKEAVPLLKILNDPLLKSFISRTYKQASYQMTDGSRQSLEEPHVAELAFDKDLTLRLPVAISVMEVNLKDGFLQSPLAVSLLEKFKEGDQSLENILDKSSTENTQSTQPIEKT